MQAHSTRIRTFAVAGIVAAAVLATGSPASTKSPTRTQPQQARQLAQLDSVQPGRDGDETYIWMVNGVRRGIPFR
jgi:hypothetical protein